LLVHAGGYSKRLANHTISGKIFCPIPFPLNEAVSHISMLELKLIMFIDFPKKMKGGVFLTCADDIQLFDAEGNNELKSAFVCPTEFISI
jgi:fucose-1-phosphate guanylyltransferase